MALISDIVSVAISIQDASPSIVNFGTILLVGNDPGLDSGAVRSFETTPNGLTAYITAGGTLGSPLYNMLATVAAQTLKPPTVKTFSVAGSTNQYTVQVLTAVEGTEYAITVNGTKCAYTAMNGDTADDIATALELLIEDVTGVVSSPTTDTITIDPDSPATDVALSAYDPSLLKVDAVITDANYDTYLTTAASLDPDFYGVCIDSSGDANIADAASWCETNQKLFAATSQDATVLAGAGDIGSTLFAAGYHRTGLWYSNDHDSQLGCAIMATEFAKNPGASWWGMKRLAGVTRDLLTPTHIANLQSTNTNYYTATQGVNHTMSGIAASGRGLQVTRDVDWLKARIEQRMLALQLNTDKIIYDEKGISTVKGELIATLQEAQSKGVIKAGFTVTAPALADIASVDITAGHLPNLQFSADLAYPIKKVTVVGTLT